MGKKDNGMSYKRCYKKKVFVVPLLLFKSYLERLERAWFEGLRSNGSNWIIKHKVNNNNRLCMRQRIRLLSMQLPRQDNETYNSSVFLRSFPCSWDWPIAGEWNRPEHMPLQLHHYKFANATVSIKREREIQNKNTAAANENVLFKTTPRFCWLTLVVKAETTPKNAKSANARGIFMIRKSAAEASW